MWFYRMWIFYFSQHHCWKDFFLHYLGIFIKNQLASNVWVYFQTINFNPMSHVPIFALKNIVLKIIIVTLYWVQESGSVSPPTLFPFKIVLNTLSPLPFYMYFGVSKRFPNFAHILKEPPCSYLDFSLLFHWFLVPFFHFRFTLLFIVSSFSFLL